MQRQASVLSLTRSYYYHGGLALIARVQRAHFVTFPVIS